MKLISSLASLFITSLTVAPAAELNTIPFKTIQGEEKTLADYEGKVVLIVNTASKCGLTPQYEALEALYDKYQDKGLVILGFPCNDFGNQEPGTLEEITEFCKTKYDISFPLMEKVHVKGKEQHPLYAKLTGEGGIFPGDVKWNFGKFLINKDGKAIARFEPRQKPGSPEIVAAIEKELAD